MYTRIVVVLGLVLGLFVAGPAAPSAHAASEKSQGPATAHQLEHHHQAVAKLKALLNDVERQFQDVSSRTDATVAELKKRGKPLTAGQMAAVVNHKASFTRAFDDAKGKVAEMEAMLRNYRDDMESKYKACEEAGNSSYQILISIVKTINEELGVFSKSLS